MYYQSHLVQQSDVIRSVIDNFLFTSIKSKAISRTFGQAFIIGAFKSYRKMVALSMRMVLAKEHIYIRLGNPDHEK